MAEPETKINVPAPYHKKKSTQGWASNEQFNVMYILGHKTNCPKKWPNEN